MGYLSRKALPIKRNDAEPLTREDVQFDLLDRIFSDTNVVFTSQAPGTFSKVTFRDLYVSALYHSSKCSKVLKDKMVETPAFAVELAKISLLTNVGRINTTMACMHWCYGSCMVIDRPDQAPSLSGNEDCSQNLPPCSIPAEDRWQCSGCTPH